MVQVALGPDGVVEPPVGHRGTGDAGPPDARRAEQAVECVGAAAGPAPEPDAPAIHPRLRVQPRHGRFLCRQIDLAEAAVLAVLAMLAEIVGGRIVDAEHHVTVLGHHPVPGAAAAAGPAITHHL